MPVTYGLLPYNQPDPNKIDWLNRRMHALRAHFSAFGRVSQNSAVQRQALNELANKKKKEGSGKFGAPIKTPVDFATGRNYRAGNTSAEIQGALAGGRKAYAR
jgi:hypothetical protein